MNPIRSHRRRHLQTPTSRPRHRASLVSAISGLALVLAVSGCSGGSDGEPTAEPDGSASAALAATGTAEATATTTPATTAGTTTLTDPAALLAQSLATTSASYSFTTVVDVAGVEATRIGGRAVGDSVLATIESPSGALEYVASTDGRFVRSPGEDWSVLEETVVGTGSSTGPLAGLGAPLTLGVLTATSGTEAVLSATYPPSALGLADGVPLTVELTVSGGILSAIEYGTTISGQTVTVHSAITRGTDTTPITSPVLLEN
jgi:hypothetical protein